VCAVLIAFAVSTTLLWLSVFGYVIGLAVAAWRRKPILTVAESSPEITVVVPVLNEERFITAKLRDLERTDYPRHRMTVIVVDGGSTDRTVALVEAERARGAAVELVQLNGTQGKADQLRQVMSRLPHDIIVMTDADARLEPSCIRRLVHVLTADPQTAVVGARVRPHTALLEERMHWWAVNNIWWLEGEALSAALVSAVCYAARCRTLAGMALDSTADDVSLALAASARGERVRLCRAAEAVEIRVPQTRAEFLCFRRRRGAGYARELMRGVPAGATLTWRFARCMRLFHFFVTPKLGACVATLGLLVLCTSYRWWAVAAAATFAVPALVALHSSTTLARTGLRLWRLELAAGRLLWMMIVSLFAVARGAALPPTSERWT